MSVGVEYDHEESSFTKQRSPRAGIDCVRHNASSGSDTVLVHCGHFDRSLRRMDCYYSLSFPVE